ncbi:MAG: response regulator [Gammaproteobacteria bacterium]|nr:response regulator [Gammaproteobacteria bacterium]
MSESAATQRILRVRRDYNSWVATETMEDYALRFAPRSFRKWSEARVAATALGSISFLALEAIGGAVMVSYGFTNAVCAIVAVALVIFLTGLPISYYAARFNVDIDLLARGAGFGYLGSTITSLIYASFTFIFFAIEAAIMALMFQLYFDWPLAFGYLASSLAIIPFVLHGITRLSKLQLWTFVPWVVLAVLPFACVLHKDPSLFQAWTTFGGYSPGGTQFDPLLFGAATTVCFSLIAQIGEQVDFLRFMPERGEHNRRRWWAAVICAGPGWVVPGLLKQLAGTFLAFLVIQQQLPPYRAEDPTLMYVVGFSYVFDSPKLALAAATVFVLLSQLKINVTNAYAGSLAWSNFFSRLTHSHPGRVVWLVFNVAIALLLMEVGLYQALEQVLSVYSCIAIAWIGALVADLVVNKPLGLSPPYIEFKRAHLHNINPVGVVSTLVGSLVSIVAFSGAFGTMAQAFASFIALVTAFVLAPCIAFATGGRYYIARPPAEGMHGAATHVCCICENEFEGEDMAHCPVYAGPICSLCCSIDARCGDACKKPSLHLATSRPHWLARLDPRLRDFSLTFALLATIVSALLATVYFHLYMQGLPTAGPERLQLMEASLIKIWAGLLVAVGVVAWLLVLTRESRRVAQEESARQTTLLLQEIADHQATDRALQHAKEVAEAASLAKSRFLTGMSHELRTPLNSIIGYAQIAERDAELPARYRGQLEVMRRASEHLLRLADDILDIARIEAGKLVLSSRETDFPVLLNQLIDMFRPQAAEKGLSFDFVVEGELPAGVRCDDKRLAQILINLLSNALKFTRSGQVTLAVDCRRETTSFLVADTGPGIAAQDLERMFQPFERGGGAAPGVGLGLTIARLLTGLMGGELTADSEPGRGSSFRVRLLLPKLRAVRQTDNGRPPIVGYRGARRRLLVADDQGAHRLVLSGMLEPLGFEIAQAVDGADALAQVHKARFDALLLDLAMGEPGGLELTRRLRAEDWRRPILIVSADGFEETREACFAAGASAFLLKPVHYEELITQLEHHLALRWLHGRVSAEVWQNGGRRMPALPADLHARLAQAARIGHIRAVLAVIDEIEALDDSHAPLVGELRRLAKEFLFTEMLAFIGAGEVHEHADG